MTEPEERSPTTPPLPDYEAVRRTRDDADDGSAPATPEENTVDEALGGADG